MTYRETLKEYNQVVKDLEKAKDEVETKELNKKLEYYLDLLRSY